MQPYVLVITGPVGAGKTTSIHALARLLEERDEPVAVIDVDLLRAMWPDDPADPFHARLGMANLAAIWPQFRDRGVRWMLLADVVEQPEQRVDYERAVPEAKTVIVRLDVSLERVHARLYERETGETLEWYLHRSVQLQQLMTERGVGDIVITVDDHGPDAVAKMILREIGTP